jgi:hypothetical protein
MSLRLPGTGPSPQLHDEPAEPLITPAGLLMPTTEEMKQQVKQLETVPEETGVVKPE